MSDKKKKKTKAGKIIEAVIKPYKTVYKDIGGAVIDGIKRLGGNEKNKSTFKNRDIDRITHGKGRPLGRKI
tara:strand:+ start:99 stop:311 length:213 start_codon:yes stop_codon:yes gene_type:complete